MYWDSKFHPLLPELKKDGTVEDVPVKSFISLSHELIHALHFISGEDISNHGMIYTGLDNRRHIAYREDVVTIGLGYSYSRSYPTENSIRKEAKLDPRAYYAN